MYRRRILNCGETSEPIGPSPSISLLATAASGEFSISNFRSKSGPRAGPLLNASPVDFQPLNAGELNFAIAISSAASEAIAPQQRPTKANIIRGRLDFSIAA